MKPVVFVGDRPSPQNISPEIAFVGAKCQQRLQEFIAEVNPQLYYLVNAYDVHGLLNPRLLEFTDCDEAFSFVALGNNASIALDGLAILHVKIPHPSGLNRKLNDARDTQVQLAKAFLFIRGMS